MKKPTQITIDGYYPMIFARDYIALEMKLERMGLALKEVIHTCVPDEIFEDGTTTMELMNRCDTLLADFTYCEWCKTYTNHRTQNCPEMAQAIAKSIDD